MNTLKERVDYLLRLRGLSQADAGRLGGFKNPAFINDLVIGKKRSIRGESVPKLARALRTSEDFILGKTQDPDAGVAANDSGPILGAKAPPITDHKPPKTRPEAAGGDSSHPILTRVLERMAEVGLSEDDLSERAKLSDPLDHLRLSLQAVAGKPRLDIALLNTLAKPLSTTATWLITGIGAGRPGVPAAILAPALTDPPAEDEVVPSTSRIVDAVFGGIVEAGTFREVDEFSDVAPPRVSALADDEYPYARMLVFDVRGDSMDALRPQAIPDGSRVSGLDFESLRGRVALYTGMVVVIERTRDGGHLRELSVKQLEMYEDRYEFHPRSTNERHKPIVVPHERDPDDGQEVRLLAWVREIRHRV
ncbi:hypothetical protein [Methylobacterium sp. WSM2598]|uniref:hypothetical protein n=1 Tax=Methylobacterium sp. WSM2598 TaxID=398261 RepID=UPI00039DB19A|nr:hypothetical protein [Methylobacterium sp. WSM2598]